MKNIQIKNATEKDSKLIKEWINKMYGSEYEKRILSDIEQSIHKKDEFYTIAYSNSKIIGFTGASKNKEYLDIMPNSVAVIDYIYIEKSNRNLITSYNLIKSLFKLLLDNGYTQALLQVQTFNKQRFLHYALSDKNIIKAFPNEFKSEHEDQILLIKDLKKIYNLTLSELFNKCKKYITETK